MILVRETMEYFVLISDSDRCQSLKKSISDFQKKKYYIFYILLQYHSRNFLTNFSKMCHLMKDCWFMHVKEQISIKLDIFIKVGKRYLFSTKKPVTYYTQNKHPDI